MCISVYLVDDHREIRIALERLIRRTEGFELAGSSQGFQEAIKQIPLIQPQVVLMDIQLGENESGIDIIRKIKPGNPQILFMICTIFDDDEKIFAALNAGASGYILKKMHPDRILDSIRELKEGGAPVSSQIVRKLLQAFPFENKQTVLQSRENGHPISNLSSRENEILKQLSHGFLYKEIAANLYISQETVRKHVYHIYEKLNVSNRVEAVNMFFRR